MTEAAEQTRAGGRRGDPKFVTALSRGLALLAAFRSGDGALGNTELARRTRLPKPTVTRLTYTLCKLGYLLQDGPGGPYRLGAEVLTLGYGALAATDIRERAARELERLCESDNPNVAAALGERQGLSVIYLVTHRKPGSVALAFHPGGRVPLFHSAIGRASLMALPADRQEALLEDAQRAAADAEAQGAAPDAEARARLAHGLARARADHAAHGWCGSFGEWRKEINGIAAPVPGAEGAPGYAVNVGGFSFLNPADELIARHAPRLAETVRALALSPAADD